MSRKDSKGMFAAVLGQLTQEDGTTAGSPKPKINSPHLLKVAAGVRELQDRHNLAEKLLGEGEHILELDPETVEQSAIADRFDGAYSDDAISEIVASMRESGQVVPGLVRPLPSNRYQIVYGRRRLAAARELRIPFKAVVRELSDEEAVVLQGAENTGREELTFIEKCVFALSQEQAGYRRETICASLSTGKSHVSEMIAIAKVIPAEVLKYVGSAPEIGRGRWSDLAQELGSKSQRDRALGFIRRFNGAGTFGKLVAYLDSSQTGSKAAEAHKWTAKNGKLGVSIRPNAKRTVIALERELGPSFGTWISHNLDRLFSDFQRAQEKDQTGE